MSDTMSDKLTRVSEICDILWTRNANLELENMRLAQSVVDLEKRLMEQEIRLSADTPKLQDHLFDCVLKDITRLRYESWKYRQQIAEMESAYDRLVEKNEELYEALNPDQ